MIHLILDRRPRSNRTNNAHNYTWQRYYKKKKWQSFIPHEHKGENPKQIIRKLDITMYSKENTPWPSGIYSSNVYLPPYSAIDVLMWNDL